MKFSRNTQFLLLHTWELSDEENNAVESAEIGDSISIDSMMIPAVFETDDGYSFFAFTDAKEIPEECAAEYAIVEISVEMILQEMQMVASILGKELVLELNPFSEDSSIFSVKDLKKWR